MFTDAEIEYLRSQRLGRLATVGADGQPHLIPITFLYNEDEDAIDLGGVDFGAGKKWRDGGQPEGDVPGRRHPPRAAAAGRRGDRDPRDGRAAQHGWSAINPRFPNFAEPFVRLRPTRVVAWGLDKAADTCRGMRATARTVG